MLPVFYVKLNESTAARKRMPIYLVDVTDGFTPETSVVTPTIEVSKNGGAQASGTGTFTEVGDGVYYYEFASGEIDTLGWVNVRVVKSGTSREYQGIVRITTWDDLTNYRLDELLSAPLATLPAASSVFRGLIDQTEYGSSGTFIFGTAALANVSDPWATDLPGSYTGPDAGAMLYYLYSIAGSLVGGGNTFATPWQNGVLRIAQGDTYTDTNRTALTFNQDGGNWPLLSEYAASGTNGGIFLKLTVKTDQTNRADWTGVVTNGSTLTFTCATTGSQPSQVVTCRPGTITAYLLPTSMAPGYQVFSYDMQVVAYNGTNQATLVKGECDVTDVA